MAFAQISLKDYIDMHLKNNPDENKQELTKRLKTAMKDYKNGVRCNCGSEIWVIGSASVGNGCFTCITGESYPTDDYELEGATVKSLDNNTARKHIDDLPPNKIQGFFDDDGYEINSDLIRKPSLCISCKKNDDPREEIICNMTRHDQKEESEFRCGAYENINM